MDAGAARAKHVSSATKRFEALNTWTSDDLGSQTPHSPSSLAPKEPSKKKKPFQKAQKFLSSLIRGRSSLHHCQAHPATTEWKFGCWERLFSGVKGADANIRIHQGAFELVCSSHCPTDICSLCLVLFCKRQPEMKFASVQLMQARKTKLTMERPVSSED